MEPETITTWLRGLLEQAAEAGARKALAESGGPRLVPIREAPVPYRAILAAERAGELRIYRRGRTSWVDSVELDEWIRSAPQVEPDPEAAPTDEVDQIIAANRRRRTC
jgi:hypothetical protein